MTRSKENRSFVGYVVARHVAFDPTTEEYEVGYTIAPEYWGRGLATEAGEASIEYARGSLGLKKIVGLVHPENEASANVLTKLGFRANGSARLRELGDQELVLYEAKI